MLNGCRGRDLKCCSNWTEHRQTLELRLLECHQHKHRVAAIRNLPCLLRVWGSDINTEMQLHRLWDAGYQKFCWGKAQGRESPEEKSLRCGSSVHSWPKFYSMLEKQLLSHRWVLLQSTDTHHGATGHAILIASIRKLGIHIKALTVVFIIFGFKTKCKRKGITLN